MRYAGMMKGIVSPGRGRLACLAALSLLALAACGGGGGQAAPPPVAVMPPTPPPPPPPPAASVEREILPGQTGAGITASALPHFTVTPNPAVAAKGRLFMMLPGTGATPRNYREIVRTGASRGYHALGLVYPNDVTVASLCAASADPDCIGKTRREIVTGDDNSPATSVDRANSIAGRLVALLTFLDTSFPAEGWGRYLTGGQPDWSMITVAGHSQGGGHAGYMAKLYSLDRAVMFSAPGDGASTPWLSLPNITPPSRQYGLTHNADELVPVVLVLNNWTTQGLGASGAAVSVDGAAAPYANSRMLLTSAPPNPGTPATVVAPNHAATVVDVAVPVAGGDLAYRAVWIYLAFP